MSSPKFVSGRSIGMWLTPPLKGCGWRGTAKPRWVVHHWTASENGVEQLWRTFQSRNVGYDFVTDYDGTVYQFSDPSRVYTFHAGTPDHPGAENRISISHAFINRGRLPASRGRPRAVDTSRYNGKPTPVLLPTPAQFESALWLCDRLHALFDIPLRMPLTASGRVIATATDLTKFSGHCGHYHLSRTKMDPGVGCLQRMQDEWDSRIVVDA